MQRRLVEYLLEHPCVDCGNADLRVLDLDHLDPSRKVDCISRLMQNGVWKRVAAEIEKCEVRCANCHRIKTARDVNTYKYRQQVEIDEEFADAVAARLARIFA